MHEEVIGSVRHKKDQEVLEPPLVAAGTASMPAVAAALTGTDEKGHLERGLRGLEST
jgi:hypothetical protein